MTDRAEEYRALRRQLEEEVQPFATSIDGKAFEFQVPLRDLSLKVGGYVALEGADSTRLGQVLTLQLGHLDSGHVTISTEAEPSRGGIRSSVALRVARGAGVILDGTARPFFDALVRPADNGAIHAWLEANRPRHAELGIGTLLLAPDHPARLDAGGFGRHTFLCGQSGSGKTYSLGLVLERLLLDTGLRIIVLDPNSDYVRLDRIRSGAAGDEAERYRTVAEGIRVLRATSAGERPLRLRVAELEPACRAALLQLDPVADREEYAALIGLLEQDERGRPLIDSVDELAALDRPGAQQLGLRAGNLGVADWEIWEGGKGGSLIEEMADDQWRCLVVDLGSLGTEQEQGVVANAVLGTLWRLRQRRQPVLVVIDEAHNVCPQRPESRLAELATRQAVQIAAEGRKFGLHLLISTQRPQKVHENVLGQCDNLLLMRMNSAADIGYLGEVFSFVPEGLLRQAGGFELGEALVAGKISPQPALVRFGSRISEEGGSDVPDDWAARR